MSAAAPGGSLLAVNAGSSSLKFALFSLARRGRPREWLRGTLAGLGEAPHARAAATDGTVFEQSWPERVSRRGGLRAWLDWVDAIAPAPVTAVVHRVVHGGDRFITPIRVTPASLRRLHALTSFAPLHQPRSLAPMEAVRAWRPRLAQVACFDTAFHASMRAPANRYGLPLRFEREGVRRYGFHGLSYEYVTAQLRTRLRGFVRQRVVIAHLGSGASLCALRGGRSVDTTMGFSVLDGLLMGTRCGALDPAIVLYLQREAGLGVAEVEHLLYHESGLLGVSGISADVRELERRGTRPAKEALELFSFRVAREVAALAATLGGLDVLVFTGGIGEHDAGLRAAIARRLRWLGVRLDARANRAGQGRIARGGTVAMLVVATDEEAVMAEHARKLLFPAHGRVPDQEKKSSPREDAFPLARRLDGALA